MKNEFLNNNKIRMMYTFRKNNKKGEFHKIGTTCCKVRMIFAVLILVIICFNPAYSQYSKVYDPENDYFLTRFGTAVSIWGNRMLVSNTSYKKQDQGIAYIYVYDQKENTWNIETILSVDGDAKHFGAAVALSEKYALIGAPRDNNQGKNTGAAYLFAYNDAIGEWYLEDMLISENPQDFSLFGKSVSLSGEKAIIGAPEEKEGLLKVGAAYIFTRDEFTGKWMQEERLVEKEGSLGTSVDIFNNTAIVGAPSYNGDDNEKLPGSVFIYNFEPNTEEWLRDTMITFTELPWLSHFGGSVSIFKNRFVVGAPQSEENDDIQFDSGSAFIFAFDEATNNWYPEVRLSAQDAIEDARFGAKVAINNGVVLVGEPGGIVNGKISGNGHLFYYKNTNKKWYRGDVLIKEHFGRRRHLGSLLTLSDKRAALTTLGVDTVFAYELKNQEHSLVEPLASIKLKSETKAAEHLANEVEPSNQTAEEICDNVFFFVDEMPEMVGGEEAFRERIEYPDELRGSGIEGKVYVSFVVGKQGQVIDAKIARGDHEILNQEAIDLVRRTPFTNGSQKGEPVCVSYTVPVNFMEQK